MNVGKIIFRQIGRRKVAPSDLHITAQKTSSLPKEKFDCVFPQTLIYGTIILLQMSRLPERSSLL